MTNTLTRVTIAGLFAAAAYLVSAALAGAASGIAIAFFLSHSASAGIRLTLVIVGALAGGLAGEIARTIWLHTYSSHLADSRHFLDALQISLTAAAIICAALLLDFLVARVLKRWQR
jgi:hypothetical protein